MSLFLFLLVSGVGCDFCLSLFLDFSVSVYPFLQSRQNKVFFLFLFLKQSVKLIACLYFRQAENGYLINAFLAVSIKKGISFLRKQSQRVLRSRQGILGLVFILFV